MTNLELREIVSEYCNSKNYDFIEYFKNKKYENDHALKAWIYTKEENKSAYSYRILRLQIWAPASKLIELGKINHTSMINDLRNKVKIISVSKSYPANLCNGLHYNGTLIKKKKKSYLDFNDDECLLTQKYHLITNIDNSISVDNQLDLAHLMLDSYCDSNVRCTIGTYGSVDDYDMNYKIYLVNKLTDYYDNITFNSKYITEGKTLGYYITTKCKK